MLRSEMNVLGLSETHWKGSGELVTEDGDLVIYSGGTSKRAGVGMILARGD